jgi:protein-tyrosine phosphatase
VSLRCSNRLDVPGVIDERLVLGSVEHAHDEQLLRHLHVSFVLDVENPRKRSASSPPLDAAIAGGRVELDDDYSFESFKAAVTKATEMIRTARGEDRTVFVFCTHGNNEGAVVCITYLMIAESWTLERAYKHVLQKRPASAPRHVYIEKVRTSNLTYIIISTKNLSII